MHDQPDRSPRPHGDGRLHLQGARGELIAGSRHAVLRRFPHGLNEVAFATELQFGADPEQRRQHDALQQRPCMEVDLIGQPGIAGRISGRHIVDAERTAVRKHDALPNDQCPALPERDHAVVGTDQPRALRNEQNAPGRAVEHALSDLRGDKPRYARATDPFARIGERTVSVQVTSVVRASDQSFQVKWTETAFDRGAQTGVSHWTAILTVKQKPPISADTLRKNPLGIYIDAIDWSRELDPPAQPAPTPTAAAGTPSPAVPSGSPLDATLATVPANPSLENQ